MFVRKGPAGPGAAPAASRGGAHSFAIARLQEDFSSFDGGRVAQVVYPDPDNLLLFQVIITPDEGFWVRGRFQFTVEVPSNYPYKPPAVHCDTLVYHPNIDLEGHVCLNILRESWTPVMGIDSVIYGLVFLFCEPNPEDPLNKAAAEDLLGDVTSFKEKVQLSMTGKKLTINGKKYEFPKVLQSGKR